MLQSFECENLAQFEVANRESSHDKSQRCPEFLVLFESHNNCVSTLHQVSSRDVMHSLSMSWQIIVLARNRFCALPTLGTHQTQVYTFALAFATSTPCAHPSIFRHLVCHSRICTEQDNIAQRSSTAQQSWRLKSESQPPHQRSTSLTEPANTATTSTTEESLTFRTASRRNAQWTTAVPRCGSAPGVTCALTTARQLRCVCLILAFGT